MYVIKEELRAAEMFCKQSTIQTCFVSLAARSKKSSLIKWLKSGDSIS